MIVQVVVCVVLLVSQGERDGGGDCTVVVTTYEYITQQHGVQGNRFIHNTAKLGSASSIETRL